MFIQHRSRGGTPGVPFDHLVHDTWYLGGETGKLYYYYEGHRGTPHLVRAGKGVDCTQRYQRAGTFIPIDVTIHVHNDPCRRCCDSVPHDSMA